MATDWPPPGWTGTNIFGLPDTGEGPAGDQFTWPPPGWLPQPEPLQDPLAAEGDGTGLLEPHSQEEPSPLATDEELGMIEPETFDERVGFDAQLEAPRVPGRLSVGGGHTVDTRLPLTEQVQQAPGQLESDPRLDPDFDPNIAPTREEAAQGAIDAHVEAQKTPWHEGLDKDTIDPSRLARQPQMLAELEYDQNQKAQQYVADQMKLAQERDQAAASAIERQRDFVLTTREKKLQELEAATDHAAENRFSTGERIAMAVAGFLGGIQSARTGRNMGLEAVNKMVDRAIAQEQADYTRKKTVLDEELMRDMDDIERQTVLRMGAMKAAQQKILQELPGLDPKGSRAVALAKAAQAIGGAQADAAQKLEEWEHKKATDWAKIRISAMGKAARAGGTGTGLGRGPKGGLTLSTPGVVPNAFGGEHYGTYRDKVSEQQKNKFMERKYARDYMVRVVKETIQVINEEGQMYGGVGAKYLPRSAKVQEAIGRFYTAFAWYRNKLAGANVSKDEGTVIAKGLPPIDELLRSDPTGQMRGFLSAMAIGQHVDNINTLKPPPGQTEAYNPRGDFLSGTKKAPKREYTVPELTDLLNNSKQPWNLISLIEQRIDLLKRQPDTTIRPGDREALEGASKRLLKLASDSGDSDLKKAAKVITTRARNAYVRAEGRQEEIASEGRKTSRQARKEGQRRIKQLKLDWDRAKKEGRNDDAKKIRGRIQKLRDEIKHLTPQKKIAPKIDISGFAEGFGEGVSE